MFQLIQKLAAPLIAGYEDHRVRFQRPLGRFFICLDEKIVVGADRGRIAFHLVNVLVFRQRLFLALNQAVQPLQKHLGFRRAGVLPDKLLQDRPRQGWIHPQGADLLGLDLLPVIRGKFSVDKPRLIQPVHQVQHIVHELLRGIGQFRHGRRFLGGSLYFCLFRLLGGQVDAALLANFRKMAVNAGDEGIGRLGDSLQAGFQLRQRPVLGPCGDVAQAVGPGLNAIILAHRIGNALRLHFHGVLVLGLGWLLGFVPSGGGKPGMLLVMKRGVGDLMDGSAHRLHLAHALPDGDGLLGKIAKAV